jgi:hypothetical protein
MCSTNATSLERRLFWQQKILPEILLLKSHRHGFFRFISLLGILLRILLRILLLRILLLLLLWRILHALDLARLHLNGDRHAEPLLLTELSLLVLLDKIAWGAWRDRVSRRTPLRAFQLEELTAPCAETVGTAYTK